MRSYVATEEAFPTAGGTEIIPKKKILVTRNTTRNQLGTVLIKFILLIFTIIFLQHGSVSQQTVAKKHGDTKDTFVKGKIIGEDAHCLFSITHET